MEEHEWVLRSFWLLPPHPSLPLSLMFVLILPVREIIRGGRISPIMKTCLQILFCESLKFTFLTWMKILDKFKNKDSPEKKLHEVTDLWELHFLMFLIWAHDVQLLSSSHDNFIPKRKNFLQNVSKVNSCLKVILNVNQKHSMETYPRWHFQPLIKFQYFMKKMFWTNKTLKKHRICFQTISILFWNILFFAFSTSKFAQRTPCSGGWYVRRSLLTGYNCLNQYQK